MPEHSASLSSEQLQGWIEETLLAETSTHQIPDIHTKLKVPNHRWRVISAMQKAVRRGDTTTALRASHAILDADPEYIWRRMTVIMLEEGGCVDLDLQVMYAWMAGKKAWRAKNGGDWKFLSYFIKNLCANPKDRLTDELICEMIFDPQVQEKTTREWALAPEDKLAAIVQDKMTPRSLRLVALNYLAGTYNFPNEALVKEIPGNINNLISAVSGMVPPAVQFLIRSSASRMREGMPIAFPLAWEMYRSSSSTHTTSYESLLDLGMTGTVPSCAIDQHCQEGKRAIAYFLKACEPMSQFLGKCTVEGNYRAIIGTMLFFLEGHQVNERLRYAGTENIVLNIRRAHLARYGFSKADADDAYALLATHLDDLHAARLKMVA